MTGPILIANLLTLARFPLTAVYCVCLFRGRFTPLILGPVFAAIVISDILDGKIARRYDAKTDFGAALDVSADLFFILASMTTLCRQRLFPAWGIAVIGLKFLEFWITSRFAPSSDSAYFWFDLPGRCAVSIWYALPILIPIYASYRSNAEASAVVTLILIPTVALSLVSGLSRVRETVSGESCGITPSSPKNRISSRLKVQLKEKSELSEGKTYEKQRNPYQSLRHGRSRSRTAAETDRHIPELTERR